MQGHVDSGDKDAPKRDKSVEELKTYIEEPEAAHDQVEEPEAPGLRSLMFGAVRAPAPARPHGHRGERRPKALLRTAQESTPTISVGGDQYLTTSEAAKYCRFRTPGGLRKAWHNLQVFPSGRRGGRNMLLWRKDELDRFCRGEPLLQSQTAGLLMPPAVKNGKGEE